MTARRRSIATRRLGASFIRAGVALAFVTAAGGCKGCGCGKKESEAPIQAPPPVGAASLTELTTGIGPAKGWEDGVAPTSAQWKRVIPLDDKRLVLAGDTPSETFAVISEDGGKEWRAVHAERLGWSHWGVAMDGSLVLAMGERAGAKNKDEAMLDAVKLAFAANDATTLGPSTPLFPPAKGGLKGTLNTPSAVPILISTDYAALPGAEAPRREAIFFGGRPGVADAPPTRAPAGEKLVSVPFGRPPALLSVRGKDVFVRPFPLPGKPPDKPQKIAGLVATPTLVAELSALPACEFAEWTFQRLKQPKGVVVLGVGNGKTVTIPLPPTTPATTSVGCGGSRVVVEAQNKDEKLVLVSCDFNGTCTEPQNTPFRPWPEKHEQVVMSTPTDKGIIAVMQQRAGDRWGVYLAQSNDSTIFEQTRVIGEGTGDRGRLELGAFAPMGVRVLLVLSSDITGTSRRSWYVTASDDGGANWNTP